MSFTFWEGFCQNVKFFKITSASSASPVAGAAANLSFPAFLQASRLKPFPDGMPTFERHATKEGAREKVWLWQLPPVAVSSSSSHYLPLLRRWVLLLTIRTAVLAAHWICQRANDTYPVLFISNINHLLSTLMTLDAVICSRSTISKTLKRSVFFRQVTSKKCQQTNRATCVPQIELAKKSDRENKRQKGIFSLCRVGGA